MPLLQFSRPVVSPAVILLLAGGAIACKQPPPPTPPPSEVAFITATPGPVEEYLEFTGEVRAYRTVQVRSQASGIILERSFREGSAVQRGDILYRIDAITSSAGVRSAKARLVEAQARLANSETNAKRLRPLLEGNAVAKQDVDNAESLVEQARAAVEDAEGALEAARKGLDETIVRAEISGRVGRAQLDAGTRVAGPLDVLTVIDVLDPIYVSFRPSSAQQLGWRRDPTIHQALQPGGSARVEAVLQDGNGTPLIGRIGFIDPVIDPATGTQEYRAEFQNVSQMLLPGQFVRVRIRGLTRRASIVVPQRAVLQQMGRQMVYLVDADNKVAARQVKATSWAGHDWLIEDGLAAGDRVIVDGIQKIGPGAPVRAAQFIDSSAAVATTAGPATTNPSAPAAKNDSARAGRSSGDTAGRRK